MAPGDVLFHSLSTPHGSRANPSPRLRRTLYLHFLSEPAFRESYDHPHLPWAQAMGGWSAARRSLLERCVADRLALGLSDPFAGTPLAWTASGIAAPGVPAMPVTGWHQLQASAA